MYAVLQEKCHLKLQVYGEQTPSFSITHPGKTTTIRRTAVRETCVSRYHGGPIEGSLKILETSRHYDTEGFEDKITAVWYRGRDLWVSSQLSSNMPRSGSLLDNRWDVCKNNFPILVMFSFWDIVDVVLKSQSELGLGRLRLRLFANLIRKR